jgi:hypothetical protein
MRALEYIDMHLQSLLRRPSFYLSFRELNGVGACAFFAYIHEQFRFVAHASYMSAKSCANICAGMEALISEEGSDEG